MKRKKLPLSLALITIVLGGVLLSFTYKYGDFKHLRLNAENELVVSNITPSLGYMALIRNNQVTGVITPDDLNRVQNQLSSFSSSRSTTNMVWRQLGPNNFGGRTRAIIFDNQDPTANTIIAAGVTGGLWKSQDLGISWHKTNGTSYNLNVSCMVQDANGVIYAGTGESFAAETVSGLAEIGFSSGFVGRGVYKSTNGDSFELIETTEPQFMSDTSAWSFVNEIAVDGSNDRLYAATNSGVKFSDDGGVSWGIPSYSYDTLFTSVTREYDIVCDSFEIISGSIHLFNPDTISEVIDTIINTTVANEFELFGNATDVAVNNSGSVVITVDNKCYVLDEVKNIFRNVSASPTNPDIMHNDSIFTTVSISTLYNKVDTTYNEITGDWGFYKDINQSKLPESGVTRIEFAFAPSDANILYASVINLEGGLYNIYRSDDKGVNWRIIQPGSASVSIFDGQGVYDNTLTVFPENPDKILLGGVDAWEFTKIMETGYFASKNISQSFGFSFMSDYLPANHHVYVFRPGTNNTFFAGTDGGVAIASIVEGEYVYETSNRSYFTTQFYNIAPSGFENYVVGGAQGNGSILIDGEGSSIQEGERIYRGDGGACVVSLINREILVVSDQGANLQRSEDAGVNYSSQFVGGLDLDEDFFNTPMALWECFENQNSRDSVLYYVIEEIPGGTEIQVQSNNSGQPFYYETPEDETLYPGDSILVQDLVSSRYFIASSDIVYMTNELHLFTKTPEWFTISNEDVGFGGAPQCISYSTDANHVFVGTREGRLFRISNLALAYNFDRADVSSPECIVSTREILLDNPTGQVITSIAVDPQNPSNVMITLGNYGNDNYVLYCENALDENPIFNSRQGNLPQMPVYSSIIEMTDNIIGIVGTEHGIFVTDDIRAESPVWMQQDSLMGEVPVFQLQQQIVNKVSDTVILVNGNEITKLPYPGTNNFGIVYAATYGRGLLRSNVFRKPVGVDEIYNNHSDNVFNLNVYPNPISTFASIEFEAYISSNADISVFDLTGRKVLSMTKNVKKGLNKIDLDLSSFKGSTYIVQIVVGSDVYSQKIIVN